MKKLTTIGNYFIMMMLFFAFLCSCNSKYKKLTVRDIDLKLDFNEEIDRELSSFGIIDMTDLTNDKTIDNLNLKIATYDKNKDEKFSIILLDKNGNGLHNDLNVDLIALAPSNWSKLNGPRFRELSFSPVKKNISIYIYDHFEVITDLNEHFIKTALSTPTDDYMTFPYTIPKLIKKTIYDKEINFSRIGDHKKLVYFEFWGTWCKPCVKQIPDLKKLNEKYNDRLMIVGVSANDKKETLKEVVSKIHMNWPQVQMDDEISKGFGKINAFPTGILYDQNGKLIVYGVGPKDIMEVLSKQQ